MKPEQELDALFAGMRQEEWPAERLPGFRDRLRQRTASRRRVWRWLLPAPALAASLLLFAVLRPQPAVNPPVVIAKAPAAPAIQPLAAPVSKPTRRPPSAPPPALLAKAPARGETQFIRIMTDDPDVVILWAVNGNGEAQ